MRLLKKDFDAAVKRPWSPGTCVIAQAITRMGLMTDGPWMFAIEHRLRTFQKKFDVAFAYPGDESRPALKKLRASLPITFK